MKARSNQVAIDRGVALALQIASAKQHQRGGKGGKGGKKQPLALLNGGNGDGAPGGKRGSNGKSKTTDGKPICYAYNDGTACRFTPCTFAHVCSICEGADHMRTNCPNKPACEAGLPSTAPPLPSEGGPLPSAAARISPPPGDFSHNRGSGRTGAGSFDRPVEPIIPDARVCSARTGGDAARVRSAGGVITEKTWTLRTSMLQSALKRAKSRGSANSPLSATDKTSFPAPMSDMDDHRHDIRHAIRSADKLADGSSPKQLAPGVPSFS